ncbi:MAG: hypothetical protein M3Z06_13965 [Actinomycetota bacterium]|nr:hypothetical protein [Actinomycetota bacterium]
MSSSREIEQLEAETQYYRDRVSVLRARLYGRGTATSARLEELERGLERAEVRLRERRRRETHPRDAPA